MIISFQDRFIDKILSGEMTSIIRKLSNKAEPGKELQFYQNWRTKDAKKFADAVCQEVAYVKILENVIFIGKIAHFKSKESLAEIASNDGFSTWDDMVSWFANQYGLPFEGKMIDFKVSYPTPSAQSRKM